MQPIRPPDSHHLEAALGWMGLGNFIDAAEELEKIVPILRAHPEVLTVRWRIYAHFQKWEACADIGQAIVRQRPNHPLGWNYLSVALHKAGNTGKAWACASSKLSEFKHDWQLRYNAACYACRLGLLEDAERLLHLAIELGDAQSIRTAILEDSDFEQLRKEYCL